MTCHTQCVPENKLVKTVISKEDGSQWTLMLDLRNGTGRMVSININDTDGSRTNEPRMLAGLFEV